MLFVGAGVAQHLVRPDGTPAPNSLALAENLAAEFAIKYDDLPNLSQIAQLVEVRHSRTELETFVRAQLENIEPDPVLCWFASVRWAAIFTTNYDRGIERAYELTAGAPQNAVSISAVSAIRTITPEIDVPVYHIHGSIFDPESPRILITQQDYTRFREQRNMLFNVLKTEFATSPFLYVGYSNQDYNWSVVFDEVSAEFQPKRLPRSFRIAPTTTAINKELLSIVGVETIDASCEEFVHAATALLKDTDFNHSTIDALRAKTPPALRSLFDFSPAATTRLLYNWEHVNSASFSETSNVEAFLRGERPNWSLIAKGDHFVRDLEDDLYQTLLDYLTNPKSHQWRVAVLGPAGFGTTTLLMSVAARLVKDHAGPVFYLKPSASVTPGDLEFATTQLNQRPVFVVDDSTAHAKDIRSASDHLRSEGHSAIILLGSRLNEWYQAQPHFHTEDFELEYLSDDEIRRLLDCLERHGELNELLHLPSADRAAVIRNKHGKQLLVAMREATEGISFDAILEGEYRGIQDDFSKDAYFIVCGISQLGLRIRDQLLADVLSVGVVEMFERIDATTRGVIAFDVIDTARDTNGARARHRTIAEVVWRRCGTDAQRERLLQSLIDNLNLTYRADVQVFDGLIRSDDFVQAIRTFDGRAQFFDRACQKDPTNPYIRQHYARMLRREKHLVLALGQIDAALEMSPTTKVFHHTKGMILIDMAKAETGIGVARRRMAQAEEAFRQIRSLDSGDDYSYTGLVSLYLTWSRYVSDEQEAAEYVIKAESILSEGFVNVRRKSSLWVSFADIEAELGQVKNQIMALEKASTASPTSVAPRFLLGKVLRQNGEISKAIGVLRPLVQEHPEHFRAVGELVECLLISGISWAEAIAQMRAGDTYGLRDAKFVARLMGLYFLDGQVEEYRKLREEAASRTFSLEERRAIHFRPSDRTRSMGRLRIRGRVAALRPGYAIIQPPSLPNVFCPRSAYRDAELVEGVDVEFGLGFSLRGAQGEDLLLAE